MADRLGRAAFGTPLLRFLRGDAVKPAPIHHALMLLADRGGVET